MDRQNTTNNIEATDTQRGGALHVQEVNRILAPGYHVGNVRDLILCVPDGSVQSIVTSPPFWRKRGYDGSQLMTWGGDADCEHDWQWHRRPITSGGLTPSAKASVGATKSGDQREIIDEATCKLCGGWYGALGTELHVEDYIRHCLVFTEQFMRVVKPGGLMFWNIGESYDPDGGKSIVGVPAMMMLALRDQGWKIRNVICWHKRNAMPFSGKDRLGNAHESIIIVSKSSTYKWRKVEESGRDVWDVPTQRWGHHPAIFPPEIPRRCIAHSTDPGDLVLDPFAGSGTTLAMAEVMGCQYLGFDTSSEYVEKIFPKRKRFVEDWARKNFDLKTS